MLAIFFPVLPNSTQQALYDRIDYFLVHDESYYRFAPVHRRLDFV